MSDPTVGSGVLPGGLTGDRASFRILLAIAIGAGAVASLAGASPTGQVGIDVLEVFLATVALVIVGAKAPWWLLTAVAGVACAVALSPLALVFGVVGFAVSAWISPLPDRLAARELGGALTVGLIVNSLIRSDLQVFVGLSALIGISLCAALFVAGAMCNEPPVRRLALRLAVGVLVVFGLGAAMSAIAFQTARSDAQVANRSARAGFDSARDYKLEQSSGHFRRSAEHLDAVDERVGAWWTAPGRLVPIIAQHRTAGTTASRELSVLLRGTADDLDEIPLDRIDVVDGAIDVDLVVSAAAPLDRLGVRLTDVERELSAVRSVWLHPRIDDDLDEVVSEAAELMPIVETVADAVEQAPALLGADQPRRYLMLFTTPAEARGLGGFIGNYAILHADQGRLSISASGRRSVLEQMAVKSEVALSGPDDMLATYGKFGLVNANGTVGSRSWSNLTMEPHWPSFAEAAIDLFNQSGPPPVDGVIVMDPYVLESLLKYTGPIPRPTGGPKLTRRNLAQYLLVGQYDRDVGRGERVDALEQISSDVVRRLLTGNVPKLTELVDDMRPLIDQQRFLMYTDQPAEIAVLQSAGLALGLPDIDGADAFSLALTNAGGNKIDSFLERQVELTREIVDGVPSVVARATLTNHAPIEGYTDYVIGNLVGLPRGTNNLYLVAYTSTAVERVTVDGELASAERGRDAGWETAAHFVALGPGETRTVEYVWPERSTGEILTRLQPVVRR